MKRERQKTEDLLDQLSDLPASWQDEQAIRIIDRLHGIPEVSAAGGGHLVWALEADFDVGLTTIRLFLDLSKDQFELKLRNEIGGKGGIGVARYKRDKDAYLGALERLGAVGAIEKAIAQKVTWRDILIERLKSGRGSAIKGQARGRGLEDFVEGVVKEVFGEGNYDVRCRFIGASGLSDEKSDFAIPDAEDPSILIEVKAYGATGSKQTDILGDMKRMVAEKRHDTSLLLVTDGETWKSRESDLKKLVEMQNRGEIAKIYTTVMRGELVADLLEMKASAQL